MPRRDQVKITYGPARYDSPKAVRKQIEDAKQETQESTIQEIINNPALDIAGGGGFVGEVTAYDPATREGTALYNGESFEFSNGTGTSLDIGDTVFITESDDEYYAVGIIDRVGDITPVPLPAAAAISPNFPIVSYPDLPFDLGPRDETGLFGDPNNTTYGYNTVHDLAGGLGYGSDAIACVDNSSPTAVNVFVRSTSTSLSAYPVPNVGNLDYALQQANGTMIVYNVPPGAAALYYRRPADTSWTTYTSAAYDNDRVIFDYSNEELWIWSYNSSSPGQSKFYRMSSSDTAPVDKGNLGIPDVVTTNTRFLVAGHGYLAYVRLNGVSSQFWLKPSGDDTAFTLVATFSNTSWTGLPPWVPGANTDFRDVRMTPNGDLTYIQQDTTTGTWHLRLLEQGTGTVYDYDLGIDNNYSRTYGATTYTRGALQGHMHTSSGLVILVGIATDTELGEPVYGFYPAVAAYNYVSSTYVYWDSDMVDRMAIASAILTEIPQEVSAGTIRYSTYSTTSENAAVGIQQRIYELTGL